MGSSIRPHNQSFTIFCDPDKETYKVRDNQGSRVFEIDDVGKFVLDTIKEDSDAHIVIKKVNE